ncbi:MAG: hypothetical protein JXB29_07885 [Sedimentisphaerales bacterium]|nr:hypothetical protein [Sedimentisphaerales bacterium]
MPKAETDGSIAVFITGNELGALQPCGCSGGQLGGLDRRAAVFNAAAKSRRLIIDTGSLVDGDSEQDLIKFNILLQAFGFLDYDLVNLTKEDVGITRNLGLLNGADSLPAMISAYWPSDANLPAGFTRNFDVGAKKLSVTVTCLDAKSGNLEKLKGLFVLPRTLPTFNILIVNEFKQDVIDTIRQGGLVDCLVYPGDSDRPRLVSKPPERPVVVAGGKFGKYVARLKISPKSAGPDTSGSLFDKGQGITESIDSYDVKFSAVPVAEELPRDDSLIQLYRVYQQLIKEAGLLEKQPRFILPNELIYVGSNACKSCHEYEYSKWSTKIHAHAYATLERVGSQFDPECIVCHVVGAEYESGFVSESKSSENLRNVGCENCHGPGSEHVKTAGSTKTSEPKADCDLCHTPENSANYAGNERQYFEKIIHWREPNSPGDVQ